MVVMARPSAWRDATVSCFTQNGFAVVEEPVANCTLDHRARTALVVIVELDLCNGSSEAVLSAWRNGSSAAIFAVGDIHDEVLVLAAYGAGADHVAPLDASPRQMLARVRAVLRTRAVARPQDEPDTDPPVRFDAERAVAVVGDVEVALTASEFEVLSLLVARSGRLMTRVELRSMVNGLGSSERAVDFFVRRLRAKLEQVDGVRRIMVVRGVGFRFNARATASAGGGTRGSHAAI